MMNEGWAEQFVEYAIRYAKRPFVVELGKPSVSYEETLSAAASVALKLSSFGVKRGDRLVCYAERTIPTLYVVLACAAVGAVFVNVSPLYSASFVEEIAKRCDARWIYWDEGQWSALLHTGLRGLRFEASPGADRLVLDSRLSIAESAGILRTFTAETRGDDLLVLLSTSGSTGNPKLVARTNASFCRNANLWSGESGGPDFVDGRFLFVHPLTHGFGFNVLAMAFAGGGRILIPSQLDAQASLSEVRQLDPSVLPMTPRVLRSFERQAGADWHEEPTARLFGPSAKVVLTVGGKSNAELLAMLESRGMTIREIYASSETGNIAVTPPSGWRPGQIGPFLDDVMFEFESDGELLLRVPHMTQGYVGDPIGTAAVLTGDGFYRTGDIGDCVNGYVRLHGRKRDVFSTSDGSVIFPSVIEAKLEALPWVKQAVLVGDGQPFVAALIVLEGAPFDDVADADFTLDEHAFPTEYETARRDLVALNSRLETLERVRRVVLLGRAFDATLYKTVSLGKTQRARTELVKRYASKIASIYASAPAPLSGVSIPESAALVVQS